MTTQIWHKTRLAGLALTVVAVGSVAVAAPAAAAAPRPKPNPSSSLGQPHRLHGSGPAHVPNSAHSKGALPASTTMHLDFELAPRDPSALARFATAVNTPGNPQYRHFLRRGQFASRFGADPAVAAQLRSYLAAHGLHAGLLTDGLSVSVTGTASKVEATLGTGFSSYQLTTGRKVFTNTASPALPAKLATALTGIVGLNNLALEHPQLIPAPKPKHSSTVRAPSVEVHPSTAGPTPCAAATSTANSYGGYTADKLSTAYGLTTMYGRNQTGTGQTVGILELEPYSTTDVSAYESCYGLSNTVTNENNASHPLTTTGPGSDESALDIDTVASASPGAKIIVYSAANGYQLSAYQQMATEDTAKSLSTSWGGCDSATGSAYEAAENTVFQQLASQGQDLFVAAGDTGSEGCERVTGSTILNAGDPASNPYVTAVGGTDLTTISATPTESVWNEASPYGAGGGGIATYYTMPSYQTGTGVINSYSSKSVCSSSTSYCREEPDVTASADPYHSYTIYVSGAWTGVGGTSAAAPEWASVDAVLNQVCPVGFLNSALYQAASNPGSTSALNDITSGNNDYGTVHSGSYPATTGYDIASGLGSPRTAGLAAHLCQPGAPTAVSAAPGNGQATVSFTPSTTGATPSSYVVTATDTTTPANGEQTASGTDSPVTITGLTNGDSYTFTVAADSSTANSAQSSASSTVTPSADELGAGQSLTAGQSVTNGSYRLSMQVDGNLVEYGPSGALWASFTSGAGSYAVLQGDGSLVVDNASGTALWNSGTVGNAGAYLTLSSSGALSITSSSGSLLWSPGVLVPTRRLSAGQSVTSPLSAYRLTMQSDGNLVEYGSSGSVWSTGTSSAGSYAVMQSDGNLVVYSSSGSALWNSGTVGNSGARLTVTDSGALVITTSGGTPLWGPSLLASGVRLAGGHSLTSPTGAYRLTMQTDGNLVDYTSGGTSVWSSGTLTAGSYAVMQVDGNLVIYNASGTALWWTGTQGNSGAILTLADTGQPTVTSASGTLLWSAGQLDGGQSLSAGASLFSLGRAYHLTMGTDGNLVEYTSGGTAVWSTDTFSAGSTAVMQADGNLVVYGSGGGVQWYSHTNGNPGAYLALSNSGALVIDSASGTVLATLH